MIDTMLVLDDFRRHGSRALQRWIFHNERAVKNMIIAARVAHEASAVVRSEPDEHLLTMQRSKHVGVPEKARVEWARRVDEHARKMRAMSDAAFLEHVRSREVLGATFTRKEAVQTVFRERTGVEWAPGTQEHDDAIYALQQREYPAPKKTERDQLIDEIRELNARVAALRPAMRHVLAAYVVDDAQLANRYRTAVDLREWRDELSRRLADVEAREAAETSTPAASEARLVLDVSDGIVLHGTTRADAPVVKAAPERFQWSSREGFWYIARTKDRRTDMRRVERLVAYFAGAGLPVRVEGARADAAEPVPEGLATGPAIRTVLTSTGHLASDAWTGDPATEPYFQNYEAEARTVLRMLPPGLKMERRTSSRYGQVFVFLDGADRLLTKADFARHGGPEAAAAHVAALKAEAAERASQSAEQRAAAEARLLAEARSWRDKHGRPVWRGTDTDYKIAMNIHIPWIMEISPSEYGSLSKRGKAVYDEKRRREWGASADASARWQAMVAALAKAGDITTDTEGLSDAARYVVHSATAGRLAEDARKEAAAAERAARSEMRAASSVTAPVRGQEAADRVREITALVSRGIKREAGASAIRSGVISMPSGASPGLSIRGSTWTLEPNAWANRDDRAQTGRVSGSTMEGTPEDVAAAIFAALRAMYPPLAAEADYPGYAKKHARKALGATAMKGRPQDLVLTVHGVELELRSLGDGYRLWRHPYYEHHEKRRPIIEAKGAPAEALAAVAEAAGPWAERFGTLKALSEKLMEQKRGISYHADAAGWKRLDDEYNAAIAEMRGMGG